jgi:hypothetical protein
VADEQGRVVVRQVDRCAVDVALLGEVVDLGHVLAAVDAKAAKLRLVCAWLFNLEEYGPDCVSTLVWLRASGNRLPCPLNDGAWLGEPARDVALGARIKLLVPPLLDRVLAAPFVVLRHRLLVPVREQLVGAIDVFVLALLEGLDGVGIAQPRGR